MPFDREGTLRKAEQLLRQGKLDLAIAEYRSVIEDQPADWNTANTLGDLYYRARQTDKAIAQYNDIAAHLANEGFLSKAVALYKKILKIKPDEERALWHLANISARQGLLVDARANFAALAEQRRARGDVRGEAEVRVRLGDLDTADIETRLDGARARVQLGDPAAAVQRLKHYAADLSEKGKSADALRLLTEAAKLEPSDMSLRQLLVENHVARGDFNTAGQYAQNAEQLQYLAAELLRAGREDEGLRMLSKAADADPGNPSIRANIVKRLAARGDVTGVRALLTAEVAGNDPDLLWLLAEMELRDGQIAQGTSLLHKMLADDPSRRDALVILGCSVAEANVDAGYQCIEVVAKAAIAVDEWGSAAAALNEFVNRVPNHIPALMRLVEICVDGGLEATMHSAQAQLADAYLSAGAGAEARVIAEDLVAREPWDRANLERFRRALTLLGERDIDAIIAERLSGQSPFTSTDFLWPADPGTSEVTPMPVSPQALSEPEDPLPRAESVSEPAPPADRDDASADEPQAEPAPAIEQVLKGLRDEVAEDASPEVAEQHFKLAAAYVDMGMQDEAMKALQVAARSPHHRFRAGAMLAKSYLGAGDHGQAIEWYERAVEAPAPSPTALHALLYDLASVLESNGESARALAVLLELQAAAGEYRDVPARLEQLKVQMGS